MPLAVDHLIKSSALSSRSIKICVLVIVAVSWGCVSDSAERETFEQEGPPNIIVVLVDDLRWDEIGAAGHPFIQTPNIDRVAAEGAYFTNAFTVAPLCSPSRASFLTGLYPHAHGIIDNTARNAQSHQLPTFPRRFQEAGYETAFIGKWHMGNDDTPRPGFDHWAAMRGQGEAIDPQFNIDGERTVVEGYVTDVLTDQAVQFITQPHEEPFLLYLAHKALHPNLHQRDDGSVAVIGQGGFIPAERHRGRYANAFFSRRPNAGIPPTDKPALARRIGDLPPLSATTVTAERTIRERSEMLLAVDDGLGVMLDTLEAMGRLDNTVVVVASDHGYWYGEHGLSAERRLAYEEAIRIPLLIRYPGLIPAGSTPEHLALSIDLAPTLLDLAGQPPDDSLQGRSLAPVLRGEAPAWRSSFLIEYYSDTVFQRIVNMGYQAVRTERYKYIQYRDLDGMDELYDLEEDPYELNNVINSPEAQATLEAMKQELAALLDRSDS